MSSSLNDKGYTQLNMTPLNNPFPSTNTGSRVNYTLLNSKSEKSINVRSSPITAHNIDKILSPDIITKNRIYGILRILFKIASLTLIFIAVSFVVISIDNYIVVRKELNSLSYYCNDGSKYTVNDTKTKGFVDRVKHARNLAGLEFPNINPNILTRAIEILVSMHGDNVIGSLFLTPSSSLKDNSLNYGWTGMPFEQLLKLIGKYTLNGENESISDKLKSLVGKTIFVQV
jgi:hypothetical protein